MEKPQQKKTTDKDIPNKDTRDDTVLHFQTIGVWTVMRQLKKRSWSQSLNDQYILQEGKKLLEVFPITYQFIRECFNVAPVMMVIYLLSILWSSTEVISAALPFRLQHR